MEANPHHEALRVFAIRPKQLELVSENSDELNLKWVSMKRELERSIKNVIEAHHLKSGQILFPPNVLLVLWSHCCDHVIAGKSKHEISSCNFVGVSPLTST